VQQAREAARRTQCKSNLKQVGLALHNYHDVFECLPMISWKATQPDFTIAGANVAILPYLDAGNTQDMYDFDLPYDDPENEDLKAKMPPVFKCPSNPHAGEPRERTGFQTSDFSYIRNAMDWANHRSLMESDRCMRFREAVDGLTHSIMQYESAGRAKWYVHNTKMATEWDYYTGSPAWGEEIEAWTGPFPAGWFFPAHVELDSSDPSGAYPTVSWFVGSHVINVSNWYGAPYSFHTGGVHLGMGDGSVHFISENISVDVLSALSSCNGKEVVEKF